MSLCGSLFHHNAQSVGLLYAPGPGQSRRLGPSELAATSALQYAAAVQEEESVHVVWGILLFSQKAAVPSGIGTRPHPGTNSIFMFNCVASAGMSPLDLFRPSLLETAVCPFYNTRFCTSLESNKP